jgi:hypothetical protein
MFKEKAADVLQYQRFMELVGEKRPCAPAACGEERRET